MNECCELYVDVIWVEVFFSLLIGLPNPRLVFSKLYLMILRGTGGDINVWSQNGIEKQNPINLINLDRSH